MILVISEVGSANLFVVHLAECASTGFGSRLYAPERRLTIANTRSPIYDSGRDSCVHALVHWIKSKQHGGKWIVAGDLNTFCDSGGDR